ncbi:MAG TPA: hypothetical protein VM534_10240 [Thermoanaerobaculia bacterium]|nr:hypothetical protein [Thermoanaerobaculia bacterium]
MIISRNGVSCTRRPERSTAPRHSFPRPVWPGRCRTFPGSCSPTSRTEAISLRSLTFHLRESLVPGLTLPLAVAGLAGMALAATGWKQLSPTPRILLIYFAIFYFAVELTPFKPHPGFIRYVVPIGPVVILFAFWLIETLWARSKRPLYRFVLPGVAVLLIVVPLIDAALLLVHLKRDTRELADRQVTGRVASFDVYSTFDNRTLSFRNGTGQPPPSLRLGRRLSLGDIPPETLRGLGYDWAITSSFAYGRYLRAAHIPNQKARTLQRIDNYRRYLDLPHEEVTPRWRSFAFSNPVIKIIDLRGAPVIADSSVGD